VSKDRPRFGEHLDVIKFVCKEFWLEVFGKQVDNLKTNHRGVFVLHDNCFRWLRNASRDPDGAAAGGGGGGGEAGGAGAGADGCGEDQALAEYMLLPCGVVRGALACLGFPCTVSADVSALPQTAFTVRLKQ